MLIKIIFYKYLKQRYGQQDDPRNNVNRTE